MAMIIDTKIEVYVTYKVDPIPGAFQDLLCLHLLETVCGDSNWPDEYIFVTVENIKGVSTITEIKYQFGERYDEYLAEEIGELIEEQINVWMCRTSIADVLEA